MAIMIDNKPSYSGEGLVWESLSKNLTNDVVVYNQREILDGDECDFALLIKDRGILIIEVKGWEAKYIFEVTASGQVVLTNNSPEEKKICGSPREQARKYRFQWVNYIKDTLGFSPLVLHMVCYPFITEAEYREKRLDIISEKEITLFSEDIKNPIKLGQKIDRWFNKKKGITNVRFDNAHMAEVRKCFEPSFCVNVETEKTVSNNYSVLKVYGRNLKAEEESELTDAYFAGTKVIVFVHDETELVRLSKHLQKGYNERRIIYRQNNLAIAKKDEEQGEFYCVGKGYFRTFNFEAYLITKDYTNGGDLLITEGEIDEQSDVLLKQIDDDTVFNYKQYKIEHAPIDENILVRAGAGTGKTYSMVSRIAFLRYTRKNIIHNLVDDIAMVTFTNDAADNMRTRLKDAFMNGYLLTGKNRYLQEIEAVDMIQISTIHKFAKAIIQASSVEFGLGHEFSIASGSYVKERIYEKYLDDYLVKKRENDPHISRKLRMPVHKFRKLLMNFAKQLYDKSCDIKQIKTEEFGGFDELPFFNEIIEAVIIPAENEYNQSINAKNKIDLKDSMILLNSAIHGSYKDKCNLRYKYLFIDEFQDTDDVQIDSFLELLKIIRGMKLFIVGDIKQSIYRFRGATDSAFKQIMDSETTWHEFSLTTNYRSDIRLLALFDKLFTRLGQQNYLRFEGGKDKDSLDSTILTELEEDKLITKLEYCSDDNESFHKVLFQAIKEQKAWIEALDSEKLSDEERTIAILVRENWQIKEILQEARKRGIYIETEIGGDLYQLSPALDLYKLVMALMNPKNPSILYNLMTTNYVNIKIDLQGIHGLKKEQKTEIFVEGLNKFFKNSYGKTWEEIIRETRTKPALVLLRDLYEKLQPWQKYDDNENAQRFYKANYELTLEKIIRAYSVDYLTLEVLENSLHINIVTKQQEISRQLDTETKGIRVVCTTIHKSKGLEYGTVIIPFANADISSLTKSELDVVYSDHKLAYGMRIDGPKKYYNSNYDMREEKSQRIQEESRVLYVALTRAIRNVVWLKDTTCTKPITWQRLMEE